MTDLMFDADTNDLAISNGDLLTVENADELAQRIRDKLKTFTGEWFLGLSYGIPFLTEVLVKNPNLPAIRAMLMREIQLVMGNEGRFISFDMDFNQTNRTLNVSFEIAASDAAIALTLTIP